jgi:hypothetical protein
MPIPDPLNIGTLVTWTTLPWPWPPASPITLVGRRVNSQVLSAKVAEDGRIVMQICDASDGAIVVDLMSCPLKLAEPGFIMLDLAWDVAAHIARIQINDTVIGSTDPTDAPVATYEVPRMEALRPEDLEDFSRDNAKAGIREGRVTGTATARGRLPGDRASVLASLRDETAQVVNLIGLLDAGALFHARGLANSVGLLLADGRPIPLVQLAATLVGAPLTVFTVAKPSVDFPLYPDATISFDISTEATRLYPNPTDIDVWLELKGTSLNGRSYTNRETIMAIRNATGSHSDRDLHPLVEMLRSTQSAAAGGAEHDLLVQHVRRLSTVAVSLAQAIIRRVET